jgi:hypothetical protein
MCLLLTRAGAQWVVVDPAMIAQDAQNQIVDLAKYVEMVNNQVLQINNLVQQLETLNAFNRAFGNPADLTSISGTNDTMVGLQQNVSGPTVWDFESAANGGQSLQNNQSGLYQWIEQVTPSGVPISRYEDLYRRFAVLEVAAANHAGVYWNIRQRRQAVKARMAETVCRLQEATTAAETQKLQGTLAAEGVELQALEYELTAATSQTVVQDIANRNNAEKQTQAQLEAIAADRRDAFSKFGTLMVPDIRSDLRFGRSARE